MTELYTSTHTLKPFEDSKPTGLKVDTAEITTLPILPKYPLPHSPPPLPPRKTATILEF